MIYWAYGVSDTVPVYLAGNDPSLSYSGGPYVSYLMNEEVFGDQLAVTQITDGTSNTALFAEGYTFCTGSGTYRYGYWNFYQPGYTYSYEIKYTWTGSYYIQYYGGTSTTYKYNYGYSYVPKFGLSANKTFQVQPKTSQCDPSVPQGFSSGSVQVGLADGSVRGLTSSMSATTWNAVVTPTGGEVLGSDWQ
jgi:hypothetical protein